MPVVRLSARASVDSCNDEILFELKSHSGHYAIQEIIESNPADCRRALEVERAGGRGTRDGYKDRR